MLIRVYYEDTDCGGIVYYANYLRYFERARTEFVREHGFEVAHFTGKGILFVVGHVEITYLNPARYNDLLEIQTKITEIGRASLTFSHQIHLHGTDRIVVEGSAKLVCIDSSGKPRRLPQELLKALGKV
jgi:acyl-CoA thioester hydrolase